jgi:hypothetical protein
MEVGWIVIVEKHSYDDSIKPRNLWHIYTYFTLKVVWFHPANERIEARGLRRFEKCDGANPRRLE